ERNGHEDPRLILALLLFVSVIIISLSLAVTLGSLTYWEIRKLRSISNKRSSAEQSILDAVITQTLIPFIFVYVPYSIFLNSPYFRLSLGYLPDYSSLLTCCFPAWDAVIVIFLMTDYRTVVWRVM
ncbi:hypothetical protein PMAYCL1PPCAC_25333, partial [Pristionchus mayeri]